MKQKLVLLILQKKHMLIGSHTKEDNKVKKELTFLSNTFLTFAKHLTKQQKVCALNLNYKLQMINWILLIQPLTHVSKDVNVIINSV